MSRPHNTKAGPFTNTPAHKSREATKTLINQYTHTHKFMQKKTSIPLDTVYNLCLTQITHT
jgi:hypothetical protein